jgi:hypothetical protein
LSSDTIIARRHRIINDVKGVSRVVHDVTSKRPRTIGVGVSCLVPYLGLDGFRGGWVAAWIDDHGNHGFDYSSSIGRLLSMPHQRAMIDMPIGLKMSGHRECDISARELVGASVFGGWPRFRRCRNRSA